MRALSGDLLVRGGTVVDGTGGEARRLDIRINKGRITEVGTSLKAAGEEVFDAGGAVVAPGFIDSHTHFDGSLFWDPFVDPMPLHGVTTVLTGNCSLSLVPLRPTDQGGMVDLFCYVEDLPADAFNAHVPFTWDEFAGYRAELDRRGFGVDVAALVGHTALRLFVMGPEAWERKATAGERDAMVRVLEESLRAGALGLSTSLFDTDAANRPVPSAVADDDELADLLGVLRRHDAILQFIPDLMKEDATPDVQRVAELCGRDGVLALWNSITYTPQQPERSANFLRQAGELLAAGYRVYPMASPRPFDVQINWDASMSFLAFEQGWDRLIQTHGDAKRRLIEDDSWRTTARREWDAVDGISMFPHRDLASVRIVRLGSSDSAWVGRSLAELVADRCQHPSDVLADLLLEHAFDVGLLARGVRNGDPERVAEILSDPNVVISASDAGAHLQMMCAAGDSTLLLTRHVRERRDFTLENAVWQLTGRQADLLGLHDRGRIAPGLRGDLVVFDFEDLVWGDEQMVFDVPGDTPGPRLRREARGYRATILAGVATQRDGASTGALPGRFAARKRRGR